jgi:hypothetical protein
VTNKAWASPVPWAEAVARSPGRAKYNSIRKLRAKLRRLAIVRRVRQVGFRRGVQRQLAAELGVVPSVICCDLKRILARGLPAGCAAWTQERPRGSHRPHRPTKESIMGERITVRLPPSLKAQLAAMAEREGQDLSTAIRLLLQDALAGSQVPGTGGPPLSVDHPAPASRDQDTWAQIPPRQPSPPVSGPARRQSEGFISWQEYKKRFPHGVPEATLPTAAPLPAASEP